MTRVRSLSGPHGLEAGSQTSRHPLRIRCTGSSTNSLRLRILGLSKKGDPQKRIAAIELYGTLFLVLLLMSKQPTAACRLHIPLISDNQGNVYSILNNATRKMPNAVILMELVYQIYQAGHMLAPTHSKRDDNQWADELTHPSPKGFSPALKVDIVPLFSKFALIPKLLESSDSESWFDTRAHP